MTFHLFQTSGHKNPVPHRLRSRRLGLALALLLLTTPALAQPHETYAGTPDTSPLTPHVSLPNLGIDHSGLDCSAWPVSAPAGGHLASTFGHRIHGGSADFHRGMDLRCDLDGDICCQPGGTGPVTCGDQACADPDDEVLAPINALLGGTVTRAHFGTNNSLVVRTDLQDDITIGDTTCNELFIWYSHMQNDYAPEGPNSQPWAVGHVVQADDLLGWQGKYGANTVHLHLSARMCVDNRADGDPEGTLDPEINPFQLIGTDNGLAPEILSWNATREGADVVVTVQVETDDPDFDQLEISVYDAVEHETHVRRLGYNSRDGIDVAGDNLDTHLLEPDGLSELLAIDEPDPPTPTSGLTLQARFSGLDLSFDYDSKVVVKAADVFGNTTVDERPLFGDGEIGDFVWLDENDNGLQDVGEPGLLGVTVELYRADGTFVDEVVSDALGAYAFTGLIPDDYYLRFTASGAYGATVKTPGSPNLDSDIDPQTLETVDIPVGIGEVITNIDAGFTSNCFDVPLVSFNSVWRTSDVFTADWHTTGFDDSSWSTGQGPLGFKHGLVYSTVPNSGTTSYFRIDFDVEDVSFFNEFTLALLRDDGAVVYLNGTEVMRSNMPAGPITSTTLASSHSDALVEQPLAASALADGPNVLAVEVHNRTTYDVLFDLELRASVCRSCVAEVTLPATAGTFIDSGDPNDNFGQDLEMEVDGGSDTQSSLMAWDLGILPSTAEALAADITVKITNDTGDGYPFFALTRAWDEATTTWNLAEVGNPWGQAGATGAGDTESAPLALAVLDAPVGNTHVMPVNGSGIDVINRWLDGSLSNNGVILQGDPAFSGSGDFSSDETADGPSLRVVYSTCQ